jgi:tetratricopeptide (TPR) repeat protein
MNRKFLFTRSFFCRLFLLGCIFFSISAGAQENTGHSLQNRWLKQIDELIASEHYLSAIDYIENIGSKVNFPVTDVIREKLTFKRIQIGIIQRESFFINNGIEYFRTSSDKSNKSVLAFVLADYYFELSMFSEALNYLESIELNYLSNDQHEQVQFQKAVSYFSEKKFDNAKPYFKSLMQLERSVYKNDVQYYMGFIAFSEYNYEEALKNFSAIENDPQYAKAIPFYLAYIYHDKGMESKALEYGEAYLKNADGLHLVETMQLLSSIYFNQDEYSKTASLYEQIIAQGVSLNPVQRFEWGTSYYHLDKHSKAIEQLKPLSIGKDDIAVESMFVLGLSYLDLGDKSNARTSFQYCTASNLDPSKKEIATFLDGKLSFELGFEDQGFKTITSFMDVYPNSKFYQEVKEMLLQYYTKTNNFKAAIDLLDKLDLSNPVVRNMIPRIYYGRGLELIYDVQYENAEQILRLLATYPSSNFHQLSIFWLGEISFRKNNYSNAVKLFQQYLQNPSYSSGEANEINANYNLGYCYYELEDYKKASVYFEKVFLIDNDVNDQKVRESILRAADCSYMDKNFTKAKTLYTRITASDGFGTDYATFQLAMLEGMKSPESKISMLKNAISRYPQSSYSSLMNMELADTYMSEELFDNAIPLLNKMLEQLDEHDELRPLIYLKLGIAYFNLDQVDDAIKQYNVLIKQYPSSAQTSEAMENAKLMFLENGKINDYQRFLESAGKSITQVEKDSLMYRFIQNAYAIDPSSSVLNTLDGYITQFPGGLYIANVLALKGDVLLKSKQYKEAAQVFESIATKGVTAFQEKSLQNAANIYFNELRDYASSLRCYLQLNEIASSANSQTEARRGIVKSQYQLANYADALPWARKLMEASIATKEDSVLSNAIMGYDAQMKNDYQKSTEYFRNLSSYSNAIGAESRYQIARNFFSMNDYENAEKEAIRTIEQSGSYEKWITKSYLLLAEIFLVQEDYFNAKATLKSVIEHCTLAELKTEAAEMLKVVENKEKSNNKKK